MESTARQPEVETITLIAHLHMQRAFTPDAIAYVRPDEDLPGRQVDIPKLRQGGVNCIWLSEGGPGEFVVDAAAVLRGQVEPNARPSIRTVYHGPSEAQRMIRGLDAMRRLCRDHANDLAIAESVRQARDIVAQGKIAVFPHTEALLIANDLAVLRGYHALGLRAAGLIHASLLDWVDGDLEQRDPGGLTDFGRRVVREMNAMGIVIDLSHASEQTMRDVLRESRHPVVASHANAKRLSPIMRNLSDEMIKGIAAGGGVIGIHSSSAFVDIACLTGRQDSAMQRPSPPRFDMIGRVLTPGGVDPFQFEADYRASGPLADATGTFPTVDLERLIDHVDYLVDLVGDDHVGIGTDFQYLEDAVERFDSVAKTPNVVAALRARGYSPEAVRKIMGANFLRVMETVFGE